MKQFKIGDVVKVKSYSEILKTLSGGNVSLKNGLHFARDMRMYCGKHVTIHRLRRIYGGQRIFEVEENGWLVWNEEWLIPIKRGVIL